MRLNGVHVVTATDKAWGHKVRTPIGAPTNGRDSSHLGGYSDHYRAQTCDPAWKNDPLRRGIGVQD